MKGLCLRDENSYSLSESEETLEVDLVQNAIVKYLMVQVLINQVEISSNGHNDMLIFSYHTPVNS
jgi:hypothetical protein